MYNTRRNDEPVSAPTFSSLLAVTTDCPIHYDPISLDKRATTIGRIPGQAALGDDATGARNKRIANIHVLRNIARLATTMTSLSYNSESG